MIDPEALALTGACLLFLSLVLGMSTLGEGPGYRKHAMCGWIALVSGLAALAASFWWAAA